MIHQVSSFEGSSFVRRALAALVIAGFATGALAQQRSVGGHVGVATPLLTIPSDGDETDISDVFKLVMPIGVTVKLNERLAVDFETQVVNQIDPEGTTGFVVAPGVVYNFGPFAAGLRVASAIGDPGGANFGVIPLLNKGMIPLGDATWFVEAAFPAFWHQEKPEFTLDFVIHTGIAF
jgi:hypothetical protein